MTKRRKFAEELCIELCKIKKFKLTYNEMMEIIERTGFISKKLKVDGNTPYRKFVRKQIEEGIHLGKIFDLWEIEKQIQKQK